MILFPICLLEYKILTISNNLSPATSYRPIWRIYSLLTIPIMYILFDFETYSILYVSVLCAFSTISAELFWMTLHHIWYFNIAYLVKDIINYYQVFVCLKN